MYKVKTLNSIASVGLDKFPSDLYSVHSDEPNPDAIILRSHDMHSMTIPESVIVIARAGAGTNNIPVAELTKRGIPVLNTPGGNANAVCEVVIASLFLASRNICRAWNYVKQLQGDDAELGKQVEQIKSQFAGFEIHGKTLGVIGLGNVGVKVANTAIAIGMKVIGYDPTISAAHAREISSSVIKSHSIDNLLQESDFVSIHVPLTPKTKNLINKSRLAIAKKGMVLLNFSRDSIVNHDDVIHALDNKHIRTYVTDFPCSKIKDHHEVISLPHLGASTKEAEENCAVMAVTQIRHYLEYGEIINSVNFPNVELSAEFKGMRLAIANANVSNMVAQISKKIAAANRNIDCLINQSRDDVAYTVIDINEEVSDDVINEIKGINGVLRVRSLLPK